MVTPKYHDHVLRFYNRMARLYDCTEFSRKMTRTEVLKNCDWKPGDRVLDICTGTGEMALTFANQDLEVTGIDLSNQMLVVAGNKKASRPPTWLLMDAEDLEFSDNSFDITTIVLALHHMPEDIQIRVLTEAARVTRNQVVIVDYNTPKDAKYYTAWGLFTSLIDQSEYMLEWAKQNFPSTCSAAGLDIRKKVITTWGLHQILVLEKSS